MEFILAGNSEEFILKANPILQKNQDVYSLFIGVLEGIKSGRYENPLMAWIEEEGEVLALFQMTPPHPLNIIIVKEKRTTECIKKCVRELIKNDITINSVVALKPWSYHFADFYSDARGMSYECLMDQGIYRLDQVNETLEPSLGTWRIAEKSDTSIIEKCYNLFEEEAGLKVSSQEETKEKVALFLDNQEVFLWEVSGRIVSMMKKSRPTENGVTVSFVYTLKKERKKGYGRTMVAACSKELLNEFDFCVLYTDMVNETSNKIYQEIGYRKIADSAMLGFN